MIKTINCATKEPYIHTARYSCFIFYYFSLSLCTAFQLACSWHSVLLQSQLAAEIAGLITQISPNCSTSLQALPTKPTAPPLLCSRADHTPATYRHCLTEAREPSGRAYPPTPVGEEIPHDHLRPRPPLTSNR